MRVAICDANPAGREELRMMIREALFGTSLSYTVTDYADVNDLLYDVQDGEWFDVLFLDLDSARENGVAAAQSLREWHFEGDIVLLSQTDAFAVEGYNVRAFGYLLKPVDPEKVKRLIRWGCEKVRMSFLTVSRHGNISRIPYHEILYAESRNSKCVVHRKDRTEYVMYCHLDDLQKTLSDKRFLRCHQSYLVNMDHVIGVHKEFLLDSGDVVCIRQRDIKHIRERYLSYIEEIDRDEREVFVNRV